MHCLLCHSPPASPLLRLDLTVLTNKNINQTVLSFKTAERAHRTAAVEETLVEVNTRGSWWRRVAGANPRQCPLQGRRWDREWWARRARVAKQIKSQVERKKKSVPVSSLGEEGVLASRSLMSVSFNVSVEEKTCLPGFGVSCVSERQIDAPSLLRWIQGLFPCGFRFRLACKHSTWEHVCVEFCVAATNLGPLWLNP